MHNAYRSEILGAIHESMKALHEVGAIDQQTMQEFDEACLKFDSIPTPGQEGAQACRENSPT
jgi:putative transcriptional regulator